LSPQLLNLHAGSGSGRDHRVCGENVTWPGKGSQASCDVDGGAEPVVVALDDWPVVQAHTQERERGFMIGAVADSSCQRECVVGLVAHDHDGVAESLDELIGRPE
jgi:hypothetical protein